MEKVNYEIEEAIYYNSIDEHLQTIRNVDNGLNDLESHTLLRKILLKKKYIKGIRFFRDLNVKLYKDDNNIYSFYVENMKFRYSIKTKKINYPNNSSWNVIRTKTLKKILEGDQEFLDSVINY